MTKYQSMEAFIAAATEYAKHPSETTASVLQRNLGTLGASLDLSIFDPGSSVAAEFYVSLHELANTLVSRSSLIWSVIAVLQHACKNTAARNALVETYKFTPILSRLLEANLTTEKRIRVLQLLQELTYGVKVLWQESHLPYLISTLTEWVLNSTEEELIALSLGVLVNLCYKNLHTVYTLMRTVDVKAFIRTLLKVKSYSINTRVQVSKMLIVLEQVNREIPDKDILDFATVTFTSLVNALKNRDAPLLRHTVDFFHALRQNDHSRAILANYPNYADDVQQILSVLKTDSDPECVARVMEFLVSLIGLQVHTLVPLYSKCVQIAMTWVPVEQVCSKALSLIRTIVTDIRRMKGSLEIFNELDLSVLMLVLDTDHNMGDGNASQSVESKAKLTEFLQLLQEMMRVVSLRPKVMQIFTDQVMRHVLGPVLEQGDVSSCESGPGNLFQNPATTLHVHALSLTADLAAHDSNWLTLYSELLRKKQIQMVLALGLFTGDGEVRQKVLQLTSSIGFPQECVAAVAQCMRELEPLVLVQGGTTNNSSSRDTNFAAHTFSAEMHAPLFTITQEGCLDEFIAKLQTAFDNGQIKDISTSAIMELYRYKLAAMGHAERATQASLEASNNHATRLQHRLAKVIAESSRLHQLLFYTQQCLEGSQAEKVALAAKMKDSEAQVRRTHTTQVQEIQGLKKIVIEKSGAIEQLNNAVVKYKAELETSEARVEGLRKRVDDLLTEVKSSETKSQELAAKTNELSRVIRKMEEGSTKQKQQIEEKNREITSNQNQILALKQEIEEQNQQSRKREQVLVDRDEAIKRMKTELCDLSRMRDMIFDLTAKKKEELTGS